MSNVQIFKDVTADDILLALEADAKKYTGLYVDMHDAEGRKYVKAQATIIGDILKALDRARIDKSKSYKAMVEAEAKSIRERLENANKPYTLLLDEYAAERKKVLDDKKAREAEKERLATIESDHEIGLLMNDKWDNDKDKREADKAAELKRIQDDAAAKAKQDLMNKQNAEIEADRLAKEKAANDMAHVKYVRLAIKKAFMDAGLPEEYAVTAGKLVVSNGVPHTQFNY